MYDFIVIAVAENILNVLGVFSCEFGSLHGIIVHQTACEFRCRFR